VTEDDYIELHGDRFHYRRWGEYEAPVVLVHGAGFGSRQWDLVAPLLAPTTRPYALDLRGHGESPELPEAYGIDAAVSDVREFVRVLDLRAPVMIGHSWGASIALRYAAEEGLNCRGIVLVDGGFLDSKSFETWEEREQELARRPTLDGVTISAFLEGARRHRDYAGIWSADVEQILLSYFGICRDNTLRRRVRPEKFIQIARANYDHRPAELYGRVRCPVLIVAPIESGGDDRSAKVNAWRRTSASTAKDQLAEVEVMWLDGCSHDVPLQRPRELAAAIARFMDKLDTR
jgi:pimeloyl-ACP methyl ester carboxylesterase